jgi:flagellar biosynthesis chaperone FliJ
MDASILLQLFPAVLGGSGIISLMLARKERRAAANLSNTNAVDIMQKVYQQFVKDTALEINQLREEIKRLRTVVENYKNTCQECPNHKNNPL